MHKVEVALVLVTMCLAISQSHPDGMFVVLCLTNTLHVLV
jgi:hypothetical protein